MIYSAIITCLGTLIFNIPFGYYRTYTKKFSFYWFVTIHLPVPFVIWFRSLNGISLTWALAPFLFGSYFLGQYIGKKINLRRMKLKQEEEI
ncbi:hypothetical protein K4L44_15040 [Halosquirtibacter laminarini]|uniref:Uncharacterized protein n=1 Tax=Halosquirtibacter laminarini TaxID=3374600 RepID=A0AC61NE77_9BACT|nr:hypothetical protein K4L44_15040 [Prolixibacteraceae bacterium]